MADPASSPLNVNKQLTSGRGWKGEQPPSLSRERECDDHQVPKKLLFVKAMKARSLLLLPTASKQRSWAPGAQCRSSHHHMASLTPSCQHRNTIGLKDKSFLRCLCFWCRIKVLVLLFSEKQPWNQCHQPFPDSHGRAFMSSENTTQNPHTTSPQWAWMHS